MKEKFPIVILHGWQVPAARYFPLKKIFTHAGFRVFVPQLPGFPNGPVIKKAWSLSDYLIWLKKYLQKQRLDNFFLIGHSFGGRVAIKLSASYPKKVKALVLTGVPGVRETSFKRLIFGLVAKMGKAFFVIPPFSFFQRRARKILYHLVGEWDYYQARGVMRETFKKIISENLEILLPKIKVPTLLIWGEKDQTASVSVAKKMTEEMPEAELVMISNASHQLPYEKPKIFSEKCLNFFHLNL